MSIATVWLSIGKKAGAQCAPYIMCTLHNVGQGDFLIRDVGVDFLGEVVDFTVHLCSHSDFV